MLLTKMLMGILLTEMLINNNNNNIVNDNMIVRTNILESMEKLNCRYWR